MGVNTVRGSCSARVLNMLLQAKGGYDKKLNGFLCTSPAQRPPGEVKARREWITQRMM